MEPKDVQNDAPKQPVVEVAEEKIVEIEEKPVAEKPVMPEEKKKTNVAAILAVIFGILALAGIGFGVWGMIEKNQADEKQKELATKIEDVSGKLANCLDDGELEETEVEKETEVVKEEVDTEKYIYVGEWGLKIKIPEGLDKVSYSFNQPNNNLNVNGIVGFDGRFPDFTKLYLNYDGLGAVFQVPQSSLGNIEPDPNMSEEGMDNISRCGGIYLKFVYTDGVNNYCYAHPQSVYSTGAEEQGLEIESTKMIEEMLSNPDNYSAI